MGFTKKKKQQKNTVWEGRVESLNSKTMNPPAVIIGTQVDLFHASDGGLIWLVSSGGSGGFIDA